MKKHVLSITYTPKIEPVLDGRCSQTIRAGRKVSVGDEILFHGWSGRPYRSLWSWRMRVTVIETINILISPIGLHIKLDGNNHVSIFEWVELNKIAALDFIDPPTGLALKDVLLDYLKLPKGDEAECQIIRWSLNDYK